MIRLLIVVVALLTADSPIDAACPPDSPAAVLECLSAAHRDRDLVAYESLLAPDFVAHADTGTISRDEDIEIMGRMFDQVRSVSLEFGEPISVNATEQPDEWRVDDLPFTLIVVSADEKTYTIESVLDYLDIVRDKQARFRIREMGINLN